MVDWELGTGILKIWARLTGNVTVKLENPQFGVKPHAGSSRSLGQGKPGSQGVVTASAGVLVTGGDAGIDFSCPVGMVKTDQTRHVSGAPAFPINVNVSLLEHGVSHGAG
jgi:hypothetical protein